MNQIDYLRQMRALRDDTEPAHELWPGIAAQLQGAPGQRAPHPAWTIAAAIVLAAGLLLCQQHTLKSRPGPASMARIWKPQDPRLSGAAIDLAAARQQLNLALAETPRAQYLHTLLDRTERQQQRLQQLAQL